MELLSNQMCFIFTWITLPFLWLFENTQLFGLFSLLGVQSYYPTVNIFTLSKYYNRWLYIENKAVYSIIGYLKFPTWQVTYLAKTYIKT